MGLFAHIATARLDAYAEHLGNASGVGRRSFIDDRAIASAIDPGSIRRDIRILTLGEGSLFISRWLQRHGLTANVTAVTSESQGFFDQPFDLVFAIEALRSDRPDAAFARRLRQYVRDGGRAIVALECRGADRRAHAQAWQTVFAEERFDVTAHDASQRIAKGALAYALSCILEPGLDAQHRTSFKQQARSLMNDVLTGNFGYWVFALTPA